MKGQWMGRSGLRSPLPPFLVGGLEGRGICRVERELVPGALSSLPGLHPLESWVTPTQCEQSWPTPATHLGELSSPGVAPGGPFSGLPEEGKVWGL